MYEAFSIDSACPSDCFSLGLYETPEEAQAVADNEATHYHSDSGMIFEIKQKLLFYSISKMTFRFNYI